MKSKILLIKIIVLLIICFSACEKEDELVIQMNSFVTAGTNQHSVNIQSLSNGNYRLQVAFSQKIVRIDFSIVSKVVGRESKAINLNISKPYIYLEYDEYVEAEPLVVTLYSVENEHVTISVINKK